VEVLLGFYLHEDTSLAFKRIVVVVGWRIEVGGGSGGFAGILSTQT